VRAVKRFAQVIQLLFQRPRLFIRLTPRPFEDRQPFIFDLFVALCQLTPQFACFRRVIFGPFARPARQFALVVDLVQQIIRPQLLRANLPAGLLNQFTAGWRSPARWSAPEAPV